MSARVLVLGVGAFAHAVQSILKEDGAETACYLTRSYAHYGPKTMGQTWKSEEHPSPLPIIKKFKPDIIIPQSVAWADQFWSKELVSQGWPIFSPINNAMEIEISRKKSSELCRKYGISIPIFHQVSNRFEAQKLMKKDPRA